MLWTRIYVANNASLVSSIERHFFLLNFPFTVGKSIGKIAAMRAATNEIMDRDLVTDDGFFVGFSKAIYSTISAGSDIYTLKRGAMNSIHFLCQLTG